MNIRAENMTDTEPGRYTAQMESCGQSLIADLERTRAETFDAQLKLMLAEIELCFAAAAMSIVTSSSPGEVRAAYWRAVEDVFATRGVRLDGGSDRAVPGGGGL